MKSPTGLEDYFTEKTPSSPTLPSVDDSSITNRVMCDLMFQGKSLEYIVSLLNIKCGVNALTKRGVP